MATTSTKDGAIDLETFLDRLARDGESIVIERDGRPVAILEPFGDSATRRDPARSGPMASEARLKAIMDRLPVEIGLKDTAGRYVMVSRRFEESNGVTNDEVVGKTADDLFPEETARAIEAHDAEILRTGEVSEREIEMTLDDGVHTYLTVKFPIVDAEGRVTGIGAISSDITEHKRAQETLREAYDDLEARDATRTEALTEAGKLIGGIGTIQDITDRKRDETALRESEERFRGIFEQGSVGVAVMRPDGHFAQVNQAYCDFIGYAPAELMGRHFAQVIHTDDLPGATAHWDAVMAGGAIGQVNERRYLHKSGTVLWGLASFTVLRDPDGGVTSYMVQVQDITERKRTERALQESEERLRDFAETTSDWFWEMDADLRYSYIPIGSRRLPA